MVSLIKTLLIWMLVLAIPAQGVAAAGMAFCGPHHHGGGAAAQMQPGAPATHAHHDGAAEAQHDHPHAAAQVDKVSSASAAFDKASDAGKHKCSACASCCSAGAILSSVLAVVSPLFAPTVITAVAPSVDMFAADGPERPPRIVLA